jgi:hypothetical protein
MRTIKVSLLFGILSVPLALPAAIILGWNNLGMHCMDSDYSVFSVLPPYNTIESQLIVNGSLVTSTNAGYRVTYEAVPDSSGSLNSTSAGKGNFYDYAAVLYGAVNLPVDKGLLSWWMPGPANTPQDMFFEATNHPTPTVATPVNWFRAEGIPITPFDNAFRKNPYPLMRMIAWSGAQAIATNDVVLPVSDEMDCRACHASGTQSAARPSAGWVWDGLPERDYRLNILRLHDERQFALTPDLYSSALKARGFNPQGLYRGVVADGKPVLCAACHASEALGAPSYSNTPPLTASVHAAHAGVKDPVLNATLDDSANRAACYRCHPGSTTKCLRGAMGAAVATDGSMEMQCQSCHGNMSQVGSASRVGWFMEPNCQSCHTGTATHNNGQIRYSSVFTDTNGTVRTAVDQTFATQPNVPTNGLSMFRFSAGHGGLQCEACHGSTHAEFPSTHANDNRRNLQLQGHTGVMVECANCHGTVPNTPNRGPHGMHAIDQGWISGNSTVTKHANWVETSGTTACQTCHGVDYRGSVLSRALNDRSFTASLEGGSLTLKLFRGAEVGCYNCHNGPDSETFNPSAAPTVANLSTNTSNDRPLAFTLPSNGSNLKLRIISQPENGSVGLTNNIAVYYPGPGFVGSDTFTFAAYDGMKNSNLGTGSVAVVQGAYSIGVAAYVPPTYPAQWPVAFAVVPSVTNSVAPVGFDWDFGDNTPHSSDQYAAHAYAVPGVYTWTVVASVGAQSASRTNTITIGNPVLAAANVTGNQVDLSWPKTIADTLLESTSALGPAPHWAWVTNVPSLSAGMLGVSLPADGNQLFRIRRPW